MATGEDESLPRHLVTPPGLELRESGVGDGTRGVFSLTPISEGQMYGPYAGEVILEGHDSKVDYRYAWEVYDPDSNELMHIINATKPETGNWMRYVNCARYFEEQNIVSNQVGSEIFYKAIRHIPAEEELLTWFSLSYQMQKKKKKKRKSVEVLEVKETVSGTGKKKRKTSSMSESSPVADDMKTPLLYEMMTSDSKYGKAKTASADEKKKQPKLMKSKSTGSIDVNMLKGGVKMPNTPTKKPQTASNTPIKDLVVVKSTPSPGNAKKGNSGTPKKALKVKDLIAMQAAKNGSSSKAEISPPPNKLPIPKLKKDLSTSPKVKGQPKVKTDGSVDVALAGMVLHSGHQAGKIYQFELRREHHVENKQGKKMYTCDICLAPYSHAFSLKRHFLRSHINAKYLPLSDITNCLINVVQQEASVRNCINNAERLAKDGEESRKKLDTKSKNEIAIDEEKSETSKGENEGQGEVTLPGVFRCYLCSELFDDLDEMKRHTKDHPAREKAVKKFSCEKCDMKFTHKNNLARHQEVHSESKPVSCPVCQKAFNKESNMKKHLQFHLNKNFTCTMCAEKFTTVAELRKHVRMEHPASECKMAAQLKQIGRDKTARIEPNVEIIKQVKMDQIRKKKIKVKVKKKLASMPLGGNNKGKSANSGTAGVGSENTSILDPNKPVPCPICQKRFSSVPSMKKHAQFHGNRRFSCRYCKEKFPHPFGLRKHLWSLHPAQMKQNLSRTTGVMRKIPTFKQKLEPTDVKPSLQTNMDKFTGENLASEVKQGVQPVNMLAAVPSSNKVSAEKPYSCRVCGKAFPSEANMKMHLQYHFGRTFSCRFCFKKFPHPASLRKHLNAEHPEGMVNGVLIKNKPDIILGPDGKKLKRKRRKKVKTELELMLTNGEVSVKTEVKEEDVEVKKEENVDKESVKSQERESEDLEEEQESEEEDLWEEEIRITKELKKKARLHFACVLCKKKFNSYVNMCRHKRLAHRVKKYGMPTLSRQRIAARMQDTVIVNDYLPITPAEFYSNVAENIATNLDQFIDGKREALTHYEKHVKIPDYHSVFEITPEEKTDIEWTKYNFPKSFTPWEGISSYEIEEDLLSVYDKIGFRDERAARRRLRRSRSSSDASFDKDMLDESSNQEAAKTPVKSEPKEEAPDESISFKEKAEVYFLKTESEESKSQGRYGQEPKAGQDTETEIEKPEIGESKTDGSLENNPKSESEDMDLVNDVSSKDVENQMVEVSNQMTILEEQSDTETKAVDTTENSMKGPENEDSSKDSHPDKPGDEAKCPQEIECNKESKSLKAEASDESSDSTEHPEKQDLLKDYQCESETLDIRESCVETESDLSQLKSRLKCEDEESLLHSKASDVPPLEGVKKAETPDCDSDVIDKESCVDRTLADNSKDFQADIKACASSVDCECVKECVAYLVNKCEQMHHDTDTKTDLSQSESENMILEKVVVSAQSSEPDQVDVESKAKDTNSETNCDSNEVQADSNASDNQQDSYPANSQMDITTDITMKNVLPMDVSGKACDLDKSVGFVKAKDVLAAKSKSPVHDNTCSPIQSETVSFKMSDTMNIESLAEFTTVVAVDKTNTPAGISVMTDSTDPGKMADTKSDTCHYDSSLTDETKSEDIQNKDQSDVIYDVCTSKNDLHEKTSLPVECAENVKDDPAAPNDKDSPQTPISDFLEEKAETETSSCVDKLNNKKLEPLIEQMNSGTVTCIEVPSLRELAANSKERNSVESPIALVIKDSSQSGREGSNVQSNLSSMNPLSVNVRGSDQIPKRDVFLEKAAADVRNFKNELELDTWVKEVVINDIIQKVVHNRDPEHQFIEEALNISSGTRETENTVSQKTVPEEIASVKNEDIPSHEMFMSEKDGTVDSDIKRVVESILCEVASNNITSDMKQMLEGNNNICNLKGCVKETFSRSEDFDEMDCSNVVSKDVPEEVSVQDVVADILSSVINGICSVEENGDFTDEVKFSIRGPCRRDNCTCESSQKCVMETYDNVLKSPTSIFRHLQLKRWNKEGVNELMVDISDEDETKVEEIPPQGKVIRCKPTLQLSPVPNNNFKTIAFGRNGQVNYVCGVCKKHFLETDALLRHHLKKHPSIDFSFIEVENGNDIDLLFYTWPCNYGLLASSQPFLEDCRNLDVFTCTRCGSTFKHIHRLHVHIINCDPKNYETLAAKRRKYRKKMRKQMIEAIKAKRNEQQQGKPVASVELPRKPGRPKGIFGTRKKKVEVSSDSPSKNRKRRNYELLYNPHNHVRRREMTDVLETHQCHGCENTFKTLSLLERHAKKCSGREKLQKMKTVQNTLLEEMAQKPRHTCRYCNKHFTYMKSLANHYRAFCSVRKSQQQKGLLGTEDLKDEEDLLKLIKRLELAKLESKEAELEENDGRRKRGGWPRGMKRKNRRKRHCWTYVKKKKPDEKDGAEGSLFDPMLWNPEVDWMEQLLLPGQGEEDDSEEDDEDEDEEKKEGGKVEQDAEEHEKPEQAADISQEIKSKKKDGRKKGSPSKVETITKDEPESPTKGRKLKNIKKESSTEIKEVDFKSLAEIPSPKKKSRKSTETKVVPDKQEPKASNSPAKKSKTQDGASSVELALEGAKTDGGLHLAESEGVCLLSMSDGSSGTPGSSPEKKKRKYVRKIPLEEVLLKKKRNRMLKMKMSEEALSKHNPTVSVSVDGSGDKTKVKKNLDSNAGTVKKLPPVADVKKNEIVKPALAVKTASPKQSTKNKSLLESGTVTLITVFPHNTSIETSSNPKGTDITENDSSAKSKKTTKVVTKPSPKKRKQNETQESPKKSVGTKAKSPKKVLDKKSPVSKVTKSPETASSSVASLNDCTVKAVMGLKCQKKASPKKQSGVSALSSAGETSVQKSPCEVKPKNISPKKKVSKGDTNAKKVGAVPKGVSPKKSPVKGKTTKKVTIVSPKLQKKSPKTGSVMQGPVQKGAPTLTCYEKLSDSSCSPESGKNSPDGKCPAKKRKKNQAVSSLLCEEDPDFLFDSDDCVEVISRKKPRPQLSVVQPPVLMKQVSEIGQESDISR